MLKVLKILGAFIVLNERFLSLAYSQVLDTDINAHITYNDSITFDIRKNRFLQVTLHSPQLIRHRGKKVKSGKGKFYVYVVSCPRLTVNGFEVQKGPKDVYLATISKQRRIHSLPDSLPTTANFLKGVVDNADSMVKFYKQQLLSNKKEADSLVKLIKGSRYPGATLYSQFQKIDELMSTDLYYYHFFRIFRYAKRKKKLPQFFLSPYYNKRFLHTDINKMPYGLPKIEQDTLTPPKPSIFSFLSGGGKSEKTGVPLPAQLDKQRTQNAFEKNKAGEAGKTFPTKKENPPKDRNLKKENKEESLPPTPIDDLDGLPQQ
jgi:hypothetical protein